MAAHLLHGAAVGVAQDAAGPLLGVLILGGEGAGKSSLALLLVDGCISQRTALIADDVVKVEIAGRGLVASAPAALRGLIEVRGYGPAPIRHIDALPLLLAVDLSGAAERVPEPSLFAPIKGGPSIPAYPFLWKGAEATAAARLRRMVCAISSGQSRERQQDSGQYLQNGAS